MSRSRTAPNLLQSTRTTLRGLLNRAFYRAPESWVDQHSGATLTDEQALRLLSGLTLICRADWDRAEEVYNAPGLPDGSVPTLQALLEQGEVFCIRGRVRWPWMRRQSVDRETPEDLAGLKARWSTMTGWSYDLSTALKADSVLSEAAADFVGTGNDLLCPTPTWVAARLWEQMDGTPQDLHRWIDLWSLLGYPQFSPSDAWGEGRGRAFRDLVLTMLQTENGFRGWLEPGISTISRARGQADILGYYWDAGSVCEEVLALISLLLTEIDTERGARTPEKTVAGLFTLCQTFPDLLAALEYKVSERPAVLADLLLHPPGSAFACFLIADCSYSGRAEDQEVSEPAFYAGQRDVFAYAVSILGEFLRAGTAPPADAAALLLWLHQSRQSKGRVDQTDALSAILRRELSLCTPDVLAAMVSSLDIGQGVGDLDLKKALGFKAALDLCALGAAKGAVDAAGVVTAYVPSIRKGEYPLLWSRLTSAEAAALAQLSGQEPGLRAEFLRPVDIRQALAAETEYEQRVRIRRGLAAHIGVLCRAVLGSLRDLPDDLFTALVAAVQAGAIDHSEKGRIYALSVWAGREGHLDTALVADLAAILTTPKVSAEQKEILLKSILETDEPLFLAQMMNRVPDDLQSRFEDRINAIPPEKANESGLCPTGLERVDGLLTAGTLNAAEIYLAHEETYPARKGDALMRLRLQFRLLFLREEWQAIREAKVPDSGLTVYEQQEAKDLLGRYQVLTQITAENADPAQAKAFFERRFQIRPTVENLTNWLAAVIRCLLPDNTFALLEGDALREGRAALDTLGQMRDRLAEPPSGPIFDGNRAVLLLCLGEADQAVKILSALDPDLRTEREEAFRAVALARCGRVLEATAVLDAADIRFQGRAVLEGARKHIADKMPYLMAPEVSVRENLLDNISSAMARFKGLSGPEQAKVLERGAEPLLKLMTEAVLYAGGEVVSLRPALREVLRKEDENTITDLFQRYICACLRYLGWSVSSQSRGGYSAGGNMGERDLIVRDSRSSGELAVIEAVISRGSVQKQALLSHFQKLFGYGDAKTLFHVTYVFDVGVKGVQDGLIDIAKNQPPDGFTFENIDDSGLGGGKDQTSLPQGFIARYRRERHDVEISIVFIILDMDQQDQRAAAKRTPAKQTPAKQAPSTP